MAADEKSHPDSDITALLADLTRGRVGCATPDEYVKDYLVWVDGDVRSIHTALISAGWTPPTRSVGG